MEQNQAKKRCAMNHFITRPSVETLEERMAPAAGSTGVAAQAPSASLTPGQVTTANPGIAIASPTSNPSGNQTAARLQNLNDATLFFNSTVATLATPTVPLPTVPPGGLLLPLNVSALGSLVQPVALSSLGSVNPGQPLSVASLSAYITVLSSASASVPATTTTPPVDFFSRYPESEEVPDTPARLAVLDSIWAIPDFSPVSQTGAWQGFSSLVAAAQQSATEQPTFP
jgi:hypothetical protein